MKPIFTKKVTLDEKVFLRERLLTLGASEEYFCFLESNLKNQSDQNFELVVGFGAQKIFCLKNHSINEIDQFITNTAGEWRFVQLNYTLFNHIYSKINSNKSDLFEFDPATIFVPKLTITIQNDLLAVYGDDSIYEKIFNSENISISANNHSSNKLSKFISRKEYEIQFDKIQSYLKRGDIYEMNYCIPFFIDTEKLNVIDIYNQQKSLSPAPYSAFYKSKNSYLICASPERFISKSGSTIRCYPMKGTIKKSDNPEKNENLKKTLFESEKERAENVMIVDLTRNDLSKVAKKGSVRVKELFGVYEFPQVYQMISTVEAELKNETTFSEILNALFPMGSMTGAPKLNAIKIIDETECFSRELFSGSLGYISPEGNFDFNVVIRSILYHSEKQLAMIAAGGAITVHCNANDEYDECLLKAKANLHLLGIDLSEVNL